jgi:hypothetical protein
LFDSGIFAAWERFQYLEYGGEEANIFRIQVNLDS